MNCTIYLIRHGIAEDAPPGGSDADRALTPEGQRKVTQVARGLKRLGIEPDAILSSPLKRADQTARLIAASLAPSVGVESFAPLAPGNAPKDILTALHKYRERRAVVLVGHEPSMGELVSQLLTGSPTLTAVDFKKAAVAAIYAGSLPPRTAGTLLWFLTPKQLRWISRPR